MGFIQWDGSYSVGVNEIDRQHKKLFELLSSFLGSVEENNDGAKRTLISALADYTKNHFCDEEKYFEIYGYSDQLAHKKEHQLFIDKVADIKSRVDEGKMVLTMEITKFLCEWLANHIKISDKKYSKCFKDNGLI